MAFAQRSRLRPAPGEPHPAWLKFFGFVRSLGEGCVDRVVVQDGLPIFMEHSYHGVDLTGGDGLPMAGDLGVVAGGFSPEWSALFKIAADLGYCEFHEVTVADGMPVRVGRIVNKEKLA